jgi:hypothetical protein
MFFFCFQTTVKFLLYFILQNPAAVVGVAAAVVAALVVAAVVRLSMRCLLGLLWATF